VIIVEDDLEYAKALKLRLERKCGCNVTKMYAHGISFLNDLEEIDADYVIIDHNLPQKNGSEMLQAIHAAGKNIPVILITAYKFPEYLDIIGANGAMAYVTKNEIDTICDIISYNALTSTTHIQLTPAEQNLLIGIATNLRNKDLANQFNISIEAIKKRKSKLSCKLNIPNNINSFRKYANNKGLL
jgi:DNA-binding NarL/FixJ family response regulator